MSENFRDLYKSVPPPLDTVAAPKQSRSQKTLSRILAAAAALIRERGYAHVSIADIVSRAGSSVGSFYNRFKDKDEMLLALRESQDKQTIAFLERLEDPAQWEGVGLEDMLDTMLRLIDARYTQRRRVIAAYISAAAANPDKWSAGISFRRHLIDRGVRILLLRDSEIAHPHPEAACRLVVQQALHTFDMQSLFADESAPINLAELRKMFFAFLVHM